MVLNMGPRFGQCPYCDSKDKYRWLWYIIENHTDILQSNGRLLHFAPEQPIKVKMDAEFHGEYVSCDLVEGRADQVIDMTNMGGCKNESYDYIIACNVLEHIPNEKKALEELKRVVKLGGLVILTFPIAMQIEKTYENSSIVSDEERLKVYGQEDHVRLYGKDYIERLESYGFKVNSYFPKDVMSEAEIRKNGFMQVAPIIILKK
jgi:SAM-dependent methyltransferase